QILQGIIDAYIEEEDRIVLIDYKTDYAPDPDILIRHYRTQLELYAGALRQLTGKDVAEKLIYSTYLQKTIPV
ncbi:MAG: PD-(D/E)XK nuclease family protein, partial [Lachnospiraceae bacterium]|nr:PD-(D/E)XK nuclease family protein [Lachnospiraceae bacterium]